MAQYYQTSQEHAATMLMGTYQFRQIARSYYITVGTAEKGPSFVTRRVLSHADAMRTMVRI